ncbi:hypothetical protein CJD36_018055 [Flavipsychrobacter stenotrophus]|uniref:Protein-glutamine gamma-glutamyltransferase-like C-terminal domain-containing protein n=1 Tax=Flavipsychrobacter stenotrophus TaxID=2077091 RepID=A0A2S7ST04_9BACT|nr:hypothetical protein CJD36_018055 [Flavipsychrobacter stenotrophus]
MPKRFNSFFISLLCLFIVFASLQTMASESATPVVQEQWEEMTRDKDFGYKNDLEKTEVVKESKPGAFEKILKSIAEFLGDKNVWRLIWILLAGVVVYVVYKLLLSNENILFSRKKKALPTGETEGDEQMGISDWEVLLQKAVSSNDLKLAVRYSYMWLLQMLQESELIKYREDKTNFEYYKELQHTAYKQSFKQISRQYEYVHYGNYPLSATSYNQYVDLFNNVKKQLGR